MSVGAGPTVRHDLVGSWGGEHVRLVVAEGGARVDYDCGAGVIDEPLIPDEDGNFQARGTHMFARGDSAARGGPHFTRHAATYRGWTNGTKMRLTVTLDDRGDDLGSFSLGLGQEATLDRCHVGTWGGRHIQLVVQEEGATAEYDCATGTIDGPLRPDKEGNFEARGTYQFERGGPRRPGEPRQRSHPARYRGWTDGDRMRLTVTLSDTGSEVGSFSLDLGRPAALDKCL